jgi:hypothetical protein
MGLSECTFMIEMNRYKNRKANKQGTSNNTLILKYEATIIQTAKRIDIGSINQSSAIGAVFVINLTCFHNYAEHHHQSTVQYSASTLEVSEA